MNAPKFATPLSILVSPGKVRDNVTWLSSSGELNQGAGDLFWDPEIVTQGALSYSSSYVEQRTQMLKCGAASMLQVYKSGPPALGAVSDNNLTDGIDPDSDTCWNRWATNASMLGAWEPSTLGTIRCCNFERLECFVHRNTFASRRFENQADRANGREPDRRASSACCSVVS